MKKTTIVIFCTLLISIQVQSQSEEKTGKTINHSINIEAFSVGYSITQKIKNNNFFGFGIQLGPSMLFFLNQPEYTGQFIEETDTSSNYIYKTTKTSFFSKTIDFVQAKFFYMNQINNRLLYNAGVHFGLGYLPGHENEKVHFSFGLLFEIFYGWEHFKAGTGISVDDIYKSYNSAEKSNIFSVLLCPVKIKITF